MPTTVEVPELGRSVEFPDGMSHEDMASAITSHLASIVESTQKGVEMAQRAASMFGTGQRVQESMLRGEAKKELQRQQREAQVAGDIAASEAASAGVGEQVAEFARTFPQRAIKAPFELAQAAGVPIGRPTLGPEEIAYLRSRYAAMESPLIPPQPAGPKEQAITDWLNEQASGLTSPEVVAALGSPVVAAKLAKMSPEAIGAAGRLIARGFQAQMAAGVPEAVQQTVEAPDVPSAIKGGLSTAAAVGLPLAIEAGLTKPLPKIPDYPGLRFRSERGVPTALGNEEIQAEAAKQAAMLELGRKAKVQSLRPAVKTMEGEVVAGEKGQSHNDIIEQNKIPAKEVDRREFVDQTTGQELSREQVAAAIPTEKPSEAHSSDLDKAQKTKVEPPSPPMPPVEKGPLAEAFEAEVKSENTSQLENRITQLNLHLNQLKYGLRAAGVTRDMEARWKLDWEMQLSFIQNELKRRTQAPPEPAAAPAPEPPAPPEQPPPLTEALQQELGLNQSQAQQLASAKDAWQRGQLLVQFLKEKGYKYNNLSMPETGHNAAYLEGLSDAAAKAAQILKKPVHDEGVPQMGGGLVYGPDMPAEVPEVNQFLNQKFGWTDEQIAKVFASDYEWPKDIPFSKEEHARHLEAYRKAERERDSRYQEWKSKWLKEAEDEAGAKKPPPLTEAQRAEEQAKPAVRKPKVTDPLEKDLERAKQGAPPAQGTPPEQGMAKPAPKPPAPPMEGPGGAPAEGEILEGTALKNATADLERAGVGLPEAYPTVTHDMAAAWVRSGEVERRSPGAGKKLADDLIANPERNLTDDDSALLLRYKVDLFNRMNAAAERTHIGDKSAREKADIEHAALVKEFGDLLDAVKFRGSEWGREGRWRQAMAREDFTFDTIDSLERYRRTLTDKPMNDAQKARGTQIAAEVKRRNKAAEEANAKVTDEILHEPDLTRPMSNAERRAFLAAKKTVREWAIKRAKAENKLRVAEAERDQALYEIEEASKATGDKGAMDATRRKAVAKAEAEKKARLAKAVRNEKLARLELDRVDKAEQSITRHRRAVAMQTARQERAELADPIKGVLRRIKEYVDKGEFDFNEIRNKVSADMGISNSQFMRLLGRNKRVKYLTDDMFRKQKIARDMQIMAKNWVRNMDIPIVNKALASVPSTLFRLKVGFHGTVALGTHAPMVAFQPRFWELYARNFGRMYGMAFNTAYYERQVQDLQRRPNYIKAQRAGLVNDPFQYEEFAISGTPVEGKAQISKDFINGWNQFTGMGNRGYAVLKIIRQDMFDQMWNRLPKKAQIPEVAKAIADGVNHATGVVKGMAPRGTNLALFAPRLEASRVMWMVGDPGKMFATFANWKNASIGDKVFAMNQLKEKAWVAGTFFSMLALNQGLLSAVGSDQKINGVPEYLGGGGFNPMEPDFMKFKVAGMSVSYGNPMLTMAKLPVKMALTMTYEGKGSKLVHEDEKAIYEAWKYLRTQLSPFAGTVTDLAFGRDYAQRPLPRAGFGLLEGRTDIPKRLQEHGVTEPYTWAEYSAIQFSMIPVSEGLREVWGKGGMGMDEKTQELYAKAWAVTMLMAGTGVRISEDYKLKE